jgi:hypothetical protein
MRTMNWKASDILRLMVQVTVMMFFGIGAMIVLAQTAAEAAAGPSIFWRLFSFC